MMIRRLAATLSLAVLSMSGRALAAPDIKASGQEAGQMLFVELIVNGKSAETIVPMRIRNGEMLVESRLLREAGVPAAAPGETDVAALPNMKADYDVATQTLNLDVSPDLLPVQHVRSGGNDRLPTVADYGAMLNYDAYMQRSGGSTAASLWSEQRLFGPFGTVSNDGTIRLSSGSGQKSKGYLRFDTRFRYIDENRAIAFTAGDLITRSLPWNSSVRIGGIQIARDFRVRPDLITMPLPSFAGKTAVPSAVDLFVDGYHRQSTMMAPGRFVLDSVPVVNGAGQATIVTVDAVGRQISTTIPFYVSSELLRPGLLDFSAEAGFIRRNYGLRSFDYGPAAASGTARYGLNGQITLETRGEVTRRHGLAGAGLLWSPWTIGTFNMSASRNWTGASDGTRWAAGYSYQSRSFSIAVDHEERSSGFRDLGSFDLNDLNGLRRTNRVIGTLNISRQGSIGVAYFSGTSISGQQTRLVSGSYSRSISRTASLFVSADYDLRDRRGGVQLRLVVPFGNNLVSGGVSHSRHRGWLAELDYDRAMPTDGGLGADASLATDEHGRSYGQATASWRGRTIELQAGTAFARSRQSAWASATGSIVAMEGDLFASRRITDSFAVVSTSGTVDVPVTFENQPAGKTDHRGHLFIPNVTSYLASRFAIDTMALPPDHLAASVEHQATIRQGTGAVIRLPIRKVRSATVTLVDAVGAPIAAGSLVSRENGRETQVGWDGIAYLEDLGTEDRIVVTRTGGGQCEAKVALPQDAQPLARIGPVPCL